MTFRGIFLTTTGFLVMFLLSGCRGLISELDYQSRVSKAEERLELAISGLPTPQNSTLVKRVKASTGGNLPECAGRQIQVLYGTNESSFDEVLSFYESSLPAIGWHLSLATDRGRSFDKDNEFILAVTNLYDVSFIGREAVQEGKAKFRTIYLLELHTYIILPVPPHCKGG